MVNLQIDANKPTQQEQPSGRGHRRSNRLAGQKIASSYLQRAFRGIWTEEEERYFSKGYLVYDR